MLKARNQSFFMLGAVLVQIRYQDMEIGDEIDNLSAVYGVSVA